MPAIEKAADAFFLVLTCGAVLGMLAVVVVCLLSLVR